MLLSLWIILWGTTFGLKSVTQPRGGIEGPGRGQAVGQREEHLAVLVVCFLDVGLGPELNAGICLSCITSRHQYV